MDVDLFSTHPTIHSTLPCAHALSRPPINTVNGASFASRCGFGGYRIDLGRGDGSFGRSSRPEPVAVFYLYSHIVFRICGRGQAICANVPRERRDVRADQKWMAFGP